LNARRGSPASIRRPGLAGAILKDAGTEPGALALVEFALEELYERSGGK